MVYVVKNGLIPYFDKLRLLKDTGKDYQTKRKFGDIELSKESAERFLNDPVATVSTNSSKKKCYRVLVQFKGSKYAHIYDFADIDEAYAYRDIVSQAITADPVRYIKFDKYLTLNARAFDPTRTSVTVDDFASFKKEHVYE